MKLYDLALVCRSKNAGPFQFTIDLMFEHPQEYRRVLTSPCFTAKHIGELYQIPPEQVLIKPFAEISTIKIVLPRLVPSGSPGDTDVYGSQQHFPLAAMEL